MKKIILSIVIVFVAASCQVQRKVPIRVQTLQCRVDSILSQSRNHVRVLAIIMGSNDTIIIGYRWEGYGKKCPIKKGHWLSIKYNPEECIGDRVVSTIKKNK